MSDLRGFNANEVPESTYGALPAGFYVVMATANEWKVTKAGTGRYLQYVLDVLDEAYNTKKLWVRLNLDNPNPTAVAIAQRELADFCKAVEVLTPEDSSELLNKPFIVELGVEKDDRQRENNVVKKYLHINASADSVMAPAATPRPAPATPAAAAAGASKAGPVWGVPK